jgi:hypothetical protein
MLFYVLILTILRFAFCVNGAVLPRDPETQMSPVGNEGLAKRAFPANSITAYPVSGNCNGTDHSTIADVSFDLCYVLAENTPISSIKITDFSEEIVVYLYNDIPGRCGNSTFDATMAVVAASPGEDKCYGVGYEFTAFAIFNSSSVSGDFFTAPKSFPLLRHFANCQWLRVSFR